MVSLGCCRRRDSQCGLTLVELLVTIMIIGILSSSVLFAMSAAQESARKSRTKALIATLHSLLIERWDSYLTRRIKIDVQLEQSKAVVGGGGADGQKAAAVNRLKNLRMYMKADFPDQWVDEEFINSGAGSVGFDKLGYLPRAFQYIRSLVVDYIFNTYTNAKGYSDAQRKDILEANEGAECLYLIIDKIRGDNIKWRKINESYIGDTDGDSALEYLDGWGRPINFIRWPAGFVSDLQNGLPASTQDTTSVAKIDHDPFDPLWSDIYAYRLVPLIISAGPDGLFDVAIVKLDIPNNANDRTYRWYPYYSKADADGILRRAGESMYDQNKNGTEDWHDNIHNHLISAR